MIEVLLLVLMSMIVGGVIASRAGLKGLSIALIGICLMIAFYGGKMGIPVGIIGIVSILLLWFWSDWKKPLSPLYNVQLQKSNEDKRRVLDPKLSEEYKQGFHAGLEKKYPEKFGKDALIDKLRRNLRAGLAEKYFKDGDKKSKHF